MSQPKLQFWVLSRNRPVYLRQTLRSAVAQIQPWVQIIVSDNSDSDDAEHMVCSEFPEVTLVRRKPVLPALEHFKTILEQACADYITLFHDDDVLLDGYFTGLAQLLDNQPSAAAAVCDAKIIRGETFTEDLVVGASSAVRIFNTPSELLLPYLQFQRLGPAPFPAYMYRLEKIRGLSLNPEHGGKYADVSFLAEVVKRGSIVMHVAPLVAYRIHSANDNVSEHIGSRLRLLRYILRNTPWHPKSRPIQHFRFRYWSRWYRQQSNAGKHLRRVTVVRKFLVLFGLRLVFTKPGFWLRFFNRARK
ncbi:MAG TPA: glycosyltransferase family A protein [Limnobacter sp.]|nr:glycosyltransferase family A protein [Limnobacter sp.]